MSAPTGQGRNTVTGTKPRKTGADHQFCGDAILTLINEVKRLQFELGVERGVPVALSPAADSLVYTGRETQSDAAKS